MATLTGKAANYGIPGTAVVYAANGTSEYLAGSAILLQSGEFTHNFDTNELKDADGDVVGMASNNHRLDVTMDFVPVGGDGNTALIAKGNVKFPPPLVKVTFTALNAPDAIAAVGGINDMTSVNGDYVYVGGGRISYTNEGYTKMTLPLRRYSDSSVVTRVT
jgi:hypothetical protein